MHLNLKTTISLNHEIWYNKLSLHKKTFRHTLAALIMISPNKTFQYKTEFAPELFSYSLSINKEDERGD